ncbi:MAG: hypothetical protein LM587_03705, partial [Candidatus Aenigmarchaeota archaeon]|nr:hypothetical protein [Candidatus Aenigmarchaeota archaeon]
MKGKLLGILGLLLLAVLAAPAMALELQPSNGIVGTQVYVNVSHGDPCGYVSVFFNYTKVTENRSVNCGYMGAIANFTVPSVPVIPGIYKVEVSNETCTTSTNFYVVKPASVASLADLNITYFNVNKTAVRHGEEFAVEIGFVSGPLRNVTLALVNQTKWNSIKTSIIDKGRALYADTVLSNATNWTSIQSSMRYVNDSGYLENITYVIVVFNTSSWNNTVDLYNVPATVTVIPSPVPASLETMGVGWDITAQGLNVTDVTEGGTLNIPINATKSVNIAIVENGTWDSLYTNISILEKDGVFSKAMWHKENFVNNKCETIPVQIPVPAFGVYRVVVFNTTDGYIYYYNNSTLFNVTPYPKQADLAQLGVGKVELNKTEMRALNDAIELYISGVTKTVKVAVVNQSVYDWMKGVIDKKVNMTNASLASNATDVYGEYYEISSANVSILSGLIPDDYYVVIYNNTSVAGRDWVNYYNIAGSFRVVFSPTQVPLSSLNITELKVNKSSFNYGEDVNLTVNFTGTPLANLSIVIIEAGKWDWLKARAGILNSSVLKGGSWNNTTVSSVSGNYSWTISTLDTLYPASYVVVVYNNTTNDMVNWYNDSVRFAVNPVAQKVSLSELGVAVLRLDKDVAVVGENITLTANFARDLKVVVMNESNWTTVINKYPNDKDAMNYAALQNSSNQRNYWTTINGSNITQFNVSAPDRYVLIVYENVSGAIGKYNDDTRFIAIVKATSKNITDLVDYFDVSPKSVALGDSIVISLKPNSTKLSPTNVAILSKADWDQIKGASISNSSILSKALWSEVNVSSDLAEQVPMNKPGIFVVVLYNNSSEFPDYVNYYNDSTTVTVKAADLTVSISPVTAVLGQAVNVSVTVSNAGDADAGAFKVAFYVNETKVDERAVDSLAAGANTTLIFSWTPTAVGTYTLKAVADTENTVKESNEDNNMASTTVTVKAAEPWQNYDKDRSGKIETSELITAIQDWLSNKLSTNDLINVI